MLEYIRQYRVCNTELCHMAGWIWKTIDVFFSSSGIGPESFGFISQVTTQPPNGSDDGSFSQEGIPADQLPFVDQHGFYITNGLYDLRPEVLESNFYAWRVTGNPKYIANAQSALQSFQNFIVVPGGDGGVSGLNDVTQTSFSNNDRIDDTESFFFAEVMKYLYVFWLISWRPPQKILNLANRYLTFDDPDHISLDSWVFNTEAHPFAAPTLTGSFPN